MRHPAGQGYFTDFGCVPILPLLMMDNSHTSSFVRQTNPVGARNIGSRNVRLREGGYATIVSPSAAGAFTPDILSRAFTTPMQIDVGSDGWTPPGL